MKVYILRDSQEPPENWVESFPIPDIEGKDVLKLEHEMTNRACSIALERIAEYYANNM